MELGHRLATESSGITSIHVDVVTDALGRPEAHQALPLKTPAVNQPIKQPLSIVKHPSGLHTCQSKQGAHEYSGSRRCLGWYGALRRLRGRPASALSALTHGLVFEDLGVTSVRVLPPQLPDVEERLPVNVVHQAAQVVRLKHLCSQELRTHYKSGEMRSREVQGSNTR